MLRKILTILSFTVLQAQSQRLDIDIFGGICNYQGDLQPLFFTLQNAKLGSAVILKYGVSDKLYLRGGFSFGSLGATDAKNRVDLRPRNLNFQSKLQEFSLGLEYRFISPDKLPVTPYVFVGAGAFVYNPYTFYGNSSDRIYLQPLSTEGQGLTGYPDRKPYSLTQFCIPYGGGIKWQLNCNLNVGIEIRQTKLFTDYLDDVSATYVDQNALLQQRGPMAVNVAWRGDEFDGTPYPADGRTRGNPKENDWYYFAGLTVGLKLNDCETGGFTLGGIFKPRTSGNHIKGKRIDCPKVW